jgi:ribosomal protein L16 Arg81 hydroxylase
MRAGGFGDFADKKNVKITRKGTVPGQPEQSFLVDVAEILERGRVDRDLPLEPGDLIYIPERLIRF